MTPSLAIAIVFWILGSLGLIANFGALIQSRKTNKFVSGIPLVPAICLLIAGLLSPIKWLALLALLDYGVWGILRELFSSIFASEKSHEKHQPKTNDQN